MTVLVLVAAAGAVGAVLRDELVAAFRRRGVAPPRGIAVVNLSGALVLGVVVGLAPARPCVVLTVGLLGGYTTFSTWMLQSLEAGRRGAWNVAGQVAGGVVLAAAGRALAVVVRGA